MPIVAVYAIAFMSYTLAKRSVEHLDQNRHQTPESFYPKREPSQPEINQNLKQKQTQILKSPV